MDAARFARALIPPAMVAGCALASFVAWGIEVRVVRGWPGLAWLDRFQWSSLAVCAFVALSALAAHGAPCPASPVRAAGFVVTAWVASVVAFIIARNSVYAAYLVRLPGLSTDYWLRVVAAPLVVSVGIASFGFYFAARLLRAPVRVPSVGWIAIALILTPLIGSLTGRALHPDPYDDFVHSVKFGYPMIWVNILVACAVRLGMRAARRRRADYRASR